ncbi:MAG: DUF6438 domain-containing protein [Bryobacteraceae bacterium]
MVFRSFILVLSAFLLAGQPVSPIKDWNSVRIKLSRESGFCVCAAYDVEIQGNGTVRYNGKYAVRVLGEQFGQTTQAELEELVADFVRADLGKLRPEYGHIMFDAPSYKFSLSIDGSVKIEVVDYPLVRETPAAVTALEDAIDRVAHTAQWVR